MGGGGGGAWWTPLAHGLIDVSSVRADISDAFEDFAYQNIDTAVRTYNSTLADIIDNHAPQKSRIVTVRADKPWYTAELSQESRLRLKYERKYKQSKLTVDKLHIQEQRNKYNALLSSTKKDYIKNKIENAESPKYLYKICDKLLNREQIAILPSHDCTQSLANTFVKYFLRKNWIDSKQPWNIIEFINESSSKQCFHIMWCLLRTI